MAVPYTFGAATAAIPLSQLDANFATTITLGNTAIQLGNTVTTLNNMTLPNVTIPSGNVTVGQANAVVYTNSSNVATSNATLITFDGLNLGIGGAPSAWSTTYRAVEVRGPGRAFASTGAGAGDLTMAFNAVYSSANNRWDYAYTGDPASRYSTTGGNHIFYSAPTGTAGNAITFTQVAAVGKGTTLALEGATSQSGTGITFPATQSASSDANTLDDYEEGTWTPTLNSLAGGSASITVLSATYTKIGRFVSVQFDIQSTSAFSGGASPVRIGGLPFSLTANTQRPTGMIQYQDAFQVPNGVVVPGMSSADNQIWLLASTAQSATTTFGVNVSTSTYLGSNRYIQGSIVYETS